MVARFAEDIRQYLSTESTQDVEVKAGSFLQHDWSDADVVVANASCFDEELLGDLAAKCAMLKEGALVVTLGEQLVGQDHLELVLQRALVLSTARASSGAALAFVHRRISPEGDASSAAPAPNASIFT